MSLGNFHFSISKSSEKHIKKLILGCIVVFSFILLVLSKGKFSYVGEIRTTVSDAFKPVLTNLFIPIEWSDNLLKKLQGYLFVYHKNQILEIENDSYKKKLLSLKHLESENKELKKILNFANKEEYFLVTGKVISRSSYLFKKTIVINVGKSNGVEKNMPVVSDKGLVGRIIEAGEYSSYVLLINDVNSNIPVIILDSGESAIISGSDNDILVMKYLESDIEIAKDSEIFTSGDGEIFPPSIPIGYIFKKEKNIYYIKPYTKVSKLSYVSVLVGNNLVNSEFK